MPSAESGGGYVREGSIIEASAESRFGSFLRERREAEGLTQAQLAEATGFSVARISDWEQGRRGARIKREEVERLARALPGTYPDMFFIASGYGYEMLEGKWGYQRGFKDYVKTRTELSEDLREHLIRQYKILRRVRD